MGQALSAAPVHQQLQQERGLWRLTRCWRARLICVAILVVSAAGFGLRNGRHVYSAVEPGPPLGIVGKKVGIGLVVLVRKLPISASTDCWLTFLPRPGSQEPMKSDKTD
jgi:hypothetical protein